MKFIDFTYQDIDVLIEALEAWEHTIVKDDLMATMIETMLNPRQNKKEMEEKIEKNRYESIERSKPRKEMATLLKAKLILAKQEKEENEKR